MKQFTSLRFVTVLACTLFLSVSGFAKEKEDEGTWQGQRHMGPMMMGLGMMGTNMMGRNGMGMCPLPLLEDVKVTYAETKDGMTIIYTAKDKKDIERIRKMAQIMRLSQELDEESELKKEEKKVTK